MTEGFFGQMGIGDTGSEYNTLNFLIRQALSVLRTGVPVKVVAVNGSGPGDFPTVDVQPLVNQIDGQGNQTAHGTIFGIPVFRLQGGTNGIVADPQVDDVGFLLSADRDISAVKANKGKKSNPGSFRRHNMADGVYFGAILNPAALDQAVQFKTTGVKVFDKNGTIIETSSAGVKITGNLVVTGTIKANGEITAGAGGGDSVTLTQHTHLADGIPPTPGT